MTEEINETRTVEKSECLELPEEKYWSFNGKFVWWKTIQHFISFIRGKYEMYTIAHLTEDEALMYAKVSEKLDGYVWDGKPPRQVTLSELMAEAKRDGNTGVCIEGWTPQGWAEFEYYEVEY